MTVSTNNLQDRRSQIRSTLRISELMGMASGFVLTLALSGTAFGQNPYERHHLVDANMAPGLAAQSSLLSNPQLAGFVQPVRVIVPNEARIEVGSGAGYTETFSARSTVGMQIGPVYRFKVTNIPNHPGKELYPSVEILGRLHAPEGAEQQFPIQVNILQDDLDKAIEGRMITKVIYLENSETSYPQRHVEDHQPWFDVTPNEDPMRAAERLGRPMAILRLGSRVPTNAYDDQGFNFNAPAPVMLQEPEAVNQPNIVPIVGSRPRLLTPQYPASNSDRPVADPRSYHR